MNDYETMRRYKREAMAFFEGLPPEQRAQTELMYDAFKKRLITEVRLNGGSHEGVVYGNLELRPPPTA